MQARIIALVVTPVIIGIAAIECLAQQRQEEAKPPPVVREKMEKPPVLDQRKPESKPGFEKPTAKKKKGGDKKSKKGPDTGSTDANQRRPEPKPPTE